MVKIVKFGEIKYMKREEKWKEDEREKLLVCERKWEKELKKLKL